MKVDRVKGRLRGKRSTLSPRQEPTFVAGRGHLAVFANNHWGVEARYDFARDPFQTAQRAAR